MASFLTTHDKKDCTGCSACKLKCPKEAITMQEDQEGFLYPHIDMQLCIQCGICEKICPMNNDTFGTSSYEPYYLGTWAKSKEYLMSCSTGGICTLIAEYILNKGGKVFGVIFDEEKICASHCQINNLSEQKAMRGSKYIQSDVKQTYHEAKLLLEKGILVYYTGTPCQIAGLKAFLRKDYDNLITTDLICHGVFSKKFLKYEYEMYRKWYGINITNFKFRSKRHFPWSRGGVINFNVGKKHIERFAKYSPMYYAYTFAKDKLNLRYSCYNCKYRTISKREGDIMVGDYWGGSKLYPKQFTRERKRYGVSLIKINTEKGNKIIEAIKDKVFFFPITEQDANQQPDLKGIKRYIPQERYVIYKKIEELDYEEYAAQFMNIPHFKCKGILDYYIQFLKNIIINSPLYPLILKFKNYGNK